MEFVNRSDELSIIGTHIDQHDIVVLFGRRRVGKTAIIKQLAKKRRIVYSQAIEAATGMQISQILTDFEGLFPKDAEASSWKALLALLAMQKDPVTIVLDEFPYLARSDHSLPSVLQRWIDHSKPANMSLVLLGSSQSMMHSLFADVTAPLYGRAHRVLKILPLNYRHFCLALKRDPLSRSTMVLFSMIGGIPHYWQQVRNFGDDIVQISNDLYFGSLAILSDEPDKLLKDEGLYGQQARAILESIGRGASKSGEIAGKLNVQQTSLSKPLQILMDSSLIKRMIPFGESVRTTKRTLYKIQDIATRFWFEVFSPHQSRWHHYSREKKERILHDHASKILEECWRDQFPDGSSYWESDSLEFDCVRFANESCKSVIVSELKWKKLALKEKNSLTHAIEQKFITSALAKKFTLHGVEVLDFENAARILASQ